MPNSLDTMFADWNPYGTGAIDNPDSLQYYNANLDRTYSSNPDSSDFHPNAELINARRSGNVPTSGWWERDIGGGNSQQVQRDANGVPIPGTFATHINDDSEFWLGANMAGIVMNPFNGVAAGGPSLAGNIAAGAFGAAGNGGDPLTGAAMGGLNSYMPNVGSWVGLENPALQNAFNGSVKGAITNQAQGGDWEQGAAMGAIPGLASYAGGSMSNEFPSGGSSRAPWANNNPFSMGGEYGIQGSPAPWAPGNSPSPSFVGPGGGTEGSSAMGEGNPFTQSLKSLLGFRQSDSGLGFEVSPRIGDVAQGLAGLYQGYRQRRDARDMRNQLAGRRQAYGDQLRKQLTARDAASGRRSDYAGRETQLQAELARLDSGNAGLYANLSNQSTSGLGSMLQSGLTMGGRLGVFGPQYQRQQPGYQYTPLQNNIQPLNLSPVREPMGFNESPLDQMYRRNRVVGGY